MIVLDKNSKVITINTESGVELQYPITLAVSRNNHIDGSYDSDTSLTVTLSRKLPVNVTINYTLCEADLTQAYQAAYMATKISSIFKSLYESMALTYWNQAKANPTGSFKSFTIEAGNLTNSVKYTSDTTLECITGITIEIPNDGSNRTCYAYTDSDRLVKTTSSSLSLTAFSEGYDKSMLSEGEKVSTVTFYYSKICNGANK